MPPPASASAVRAYCRRSFHSEPAMQATPTTVPSTTRSQGGTSPCSIEYLKKSSPASASATPPSPCRGAHTEELLPVDLDARHGDGRRRGGPRCGRRRRRRRWTLAERRGGRGRDRLRRRRL